ncbi:MAG: MotA/TolQ/ExbB proton channel family protein [Acetobacteraceae bacterium]|nr:MotA/TolQ/ExbB proton channel family protein [Acetobacteraceae bacterium]
MDTQLLTSRPATMLATPAEARDFLPVLRWLMLISLIGCGVIVLWQLGLVQVMFNTDRTHLSSLILALFALTSLHCLAQTWFVSKELIAVRSFREALDREPEGLFQGVTNPIHVPVDSAIARHIANLVAKARAQAGQRIDQGLLLRALASRLRRREKLGVFVSESLLRLALLGTAVGFILMLIPIAGLTAFDAESLRTALTGMSGGMATALNVTVTGIGTALLLKLQYFFLDKAIGELLAAITELTEVHIISRLERSDHVR